MPEIKWVGNQSWDTEFPEFPMPARAKVIQRPDNIFKASLPYGAPALLLSYFIIFLKWHILGTKVINPIYMPIGMLLGLALIPVHELLHAVCYPSGSLVYVGISIKKFAAFTVCHEPITKARFILMSLAPVALGLIPFLVFLLAPDSAVIAGICVPAGMIGTLSPMPDYMDVALVCKQVPKGAIIQSSNQGFFWYTDRD